MTMRIFLKNLSLLCSVVIIFAGCQPSTNQDSYAPMIQSPQQTGSEILGYSLQARPIELWTIGTGPEKILIIGTIHGNEDAGVPLAYKLRNHLVFQKNFHNRYTVMIIPNANPDGYAARTRGNAAGVDLNRNFPTRNRINNGKNGMTGLTEPESQLLHDLIIHKRFNRIVCIHQPYNCLDYDGPGEELAKVMSDYCPLPVRKLGSLPGSLGSFAGLEQGIPMITMELPASDSRLTADQLWLKYGTSLLAAITFPHPPY